MNTWRSIARWLRDARISLSLFTFSVAVLVSAIVFVALSVESLIGDYTAIADSHARLGALASTQNTLEARVNALHSYLITGNEDLIADYRNAGSDLTTSLVSLRGLVSGDAVLTQRTESLQVAIAKQNAVSEHILDAFRHGRHDLVRQLLNEDDTKLRSVDRVRSALTAFDAHEHAALGRLMSQADVTLRFAILAGTLGLSLYFIVQCIVFARMDKEAERRRGSDSSLVEANAELESSLAQLRQINRATQAVSQFGEILQNCRSVDEAVALTLHQLLRMLPTLSAEIGLFNETRDAVELHRMAPDSADGQEFRITSMASQDCWGLRRGRVHLFATGDIDPRCDHVSSSAVRSMCIPILGQGETLGIMSLVTEANVESSEQNWDVALKIAERLAPALASLKLQETLRLQSVRDQLTGLFNRRFLDESLAKEIARARRHGVPVSVIMLDVDHFKQFNDSHGHEGGDIALKAVGALLSHSVRFEDIACRYGGEEFVLVMPGAAHEFALKRAEEVRMALERLPLTVRAGSEQHVSASLGVATFPEHGMSMEHVLAAADAALYLAKSSGRNRVVGAVTAMPAPDRSKQLQYAGLRVS